MCPAAARNAERVDLTNEDKDLRSLRLQMNDGSRHAAVLPVGQFEVHQRQASTCVYAKPRTVISHAYDQIHRNNEKSLHVYRVYCKYVDCDFQDRDWHTSGSVHIVRHGDGPICAIAPQRILPNR